MIRQMHRSGQWVFHSISPFFKLFLETEIDLTGTSFCLNQGAKEVTEGPLDIQRWLAAQQHRTDGHSQSTPQA